VIARAWLGDSEWHAPYPEPAPAVFGVRPAAPDDEVRPEAVHGQRVFQSRVQVFERGLGDQEKCETVCETDLIPNLCIERVHRPNVVGKLMDESARKIEELGEPTVGLLTHQRTAAHVPPDAHFYGVSGLWIEWDLQVGHVRRTEDQVFC